MKNNITELIFLLDKSGSMAGLESDTIGGFNALIQKQKKEEGLCYVSTLLFNGETSVLHDRQKLTEIKPLTEKDYTVGGSTALIDALGGAICHTKKLHKYLEDAAPAHTLFVITTDGQENASHKYTAPQVKEMISAQKAVGWEFLFIGANIDAVETAARYGIDKERAVNYHADGRGTRILYDSISDAVCCMRQSERIAEDWSKELQADFQKRSK